MRIFLTVSLTVTLAFIFPPSAKSLGSNQDLEGSGYDLGSSGYGSGDWSFTGEEINAIDGSDRRDKIQEELLWSMKESEYIFIPNSRGIWENEEIVAAVAAGGAVGAVLTLMLTLFYTLYRKRK